MLNSSPSFTPHHHYHYPTSAPSLYCLAKASCTSDVTNVQSKVLAQPLSPPQILPTLANAISLTKRDVSSYSAKIVKVSRFIRRQTHPVVWFYLICMLVDKAHCLAYLTPKGGGGRKNGFLYPRVFELFHAESHVVISLSGNILLSN